MLKYSKKNHPSEYKTDLEIFSLLCGAGWREKTEFLVDEKGMINWKEVNSYQAKPQEIVEEYYLKQAEENEKRLAEKEEKIKIFEKIILEEKDMSNQFSLLNKLYKNEVENLNYLIKQYEEHNYSKDEIKELQEELKKVELKEKKSNQLIAQIEVKK
ncbi:MAG: hypothetical protein I3274_05500 [Candidatus Moeniiplasma glomeromycotorum]|nr:hypothetical protein [Candidatus Moeniiplasma glomeromycotorum]